MGLALPPSDGCVAEKAPSAELLVPPLHKLPAPSPRSYEEAETLGESSSYPQAAALDLGQSFAHRLRWLHAVNSLEYLREALASSVQFLEADVAAGQLLIEPGDADELAGIEDSDLVQTTWASGCVKTPCGKSIIMAHFPTEYSSNLSLDSFITAVLQHNPSSKIWRGRKSSLLLARPNHQTTLRAMRRSYSQRS